MPGTTKCRTAVVSPKLLQAWKVRGKTKKNIQEIHYNKIRKLKSLDMHSLLDAWELLKIRPKVTIVKDYYRYTKNKDIFEDIRFVSEAQVFAKLK